MKRSHWRWSVVLCATCSAVPLPLLAEGTATSADRIMSAVSAAPTAISANASIWDWPATPGQQPPVLREGSNGWTCFPDDPATPGNDPRCLDKQWLEWMDAWMNQRTPAITGSGVAYMLQGSSTASSTDPFAGEPPAGANWVAAPPHVMLLNPQQWDRQVFSTRMDMNSGGPWVMFADTPYEHLVVPLQSLPGR